MNINKGLLLSVMLLSSSLVYCMESDNSENNSNVKFAKKRINVDYSNINWGASIGKLPDEIKKEILNCIFNNLDHDNLDGLIKINNLKTVNKTFAQFLFQNYSDQLRKISDSFGKKLVDIISIEKDTFTENDLIEVTKLIKVGADNNSYSYFSENNVNGDTALMNSCWNGHINISKLLINGKSNINAQNNYGDTPLMRACRENCDLELVELLIESGGDLNLKDYRGFTAFDYLKDQANDPRSVYSSSFRDNIKKLKKILKEAMNKKN